MGELDDKVAVITGAGSGMARAATGVFVREGARVLAADISGREDETAAALGDAVVPFHVDVVDEVQVEGMFAAALEAFGRVDAVLNVAGIAGVQPVADVTLDDYERIMAVDLRGVMLGTKHGIRTMVPTGGGVILNWSSIGGMNGSRLPTSVYSAAKAGVIAFTKPPPSSTASRASGPTPSARASSRPKCPAARARRRGSPPWWPARR
jgi:NAD(P)-dependent dehydrogenase (short-subunit alcohol dehydrogenase family)